MAESVIKNYFPSQVVSDLEKISYDTLATKSHFTDLDYMLEVNSLYRSTKMSCL